MKNILFLTVLFSLLLINLNAQKEACDFPPIWDYPNSSDGAHAIIIRNSANPRINDIPLQPGDYIGGFYTDDYGELKCGGAKCWVGGNLDIMFSLFKDNPDTPEKDGFVFGETIHYKFFSWTTLKDYDVADVTYLDTLYYTTDNKWYNLSISLVTDIYALEDFDFYIDAWPNPLCIGDQLHLSAEEFVGTGGPYTFDWTSDPPGFFSNFQVPPPTQPGQTTTYFLVVSDGVFTSNAAVTVIVKNLPEADAGPDGLVCSNETYQVNGAAQYYDNSVWVTSGDGYFDDSTALSTVYTPGTEDKQNGNTTLTLIAHPLNPCVASAVDSLFLDVLPLPSVDAGADFLVCSNATANLSATGQNFDNSTIQWSTSGSGTFSDPNALNTIYTPSQGDINYGVTLTVCVGAIPPCIATACDDVAITFVKVPSCNAPSSRTKCENIPVPMAGTASNASGILWTTQGDGYFEEPSVMNTHYIAGPQDRENGGTVVTLNALPYAPCTAPATKDVNIILKPLPDVNAGNTHAICEGNSYLQLNASVEHASGDPQWETLGDGTFSSTTSLTAKYFPGPGDWQNGWFELVLSAQPVYPCTLMVSDTLHVEVVDDPTVEITTSNNQNVCEMPPFELNAEATFAGEIAWETSGDGNFVNPQELNTHYIPGPQDVLSGQAVILTVFISPISPCEIPATSSIGVTFNPAPSINAGPNQIICETETAQLSANGQHFSALEWETSGDGTFSNNSILNPVYTPGNNDIITGNVILTINAYAQAPCVVTATDNMHLTIRKLPLANAGNDATICENANHFLYNVIALNYSDLLWTTNGDGYFNNPNIKNPVYYPGEEDKANGSVMLTLTLDPVAPCVVAQSDDKTLTIVPLATADAGEDMTTCTEATLSGTAENYNSLLWTTTGDGTFSDATVLAPVYTAGAGDIENRSVVLTFTAEPLSPCTLETSDEITLFFNQPLVISDDVVDTDIFAGETLQFNFTVDSYTAGEYAWYFNGEVIDGQNTSSLIIDNLTPDNAGYYHSVFTNECGSVESTEALVSIFENSTDNMTLPQGWSGVSSYIMPNDPAMEDVFDNIVDNLVILANNDGMYWPSQNINTLGEWSVTSGYKIKMENDVQLEMNGFIRYPSQELMIPPGWSYLPVNAVCAFDVEELFGNVSEITMIKDIAQTGVYWPQLGINTLQSLYPRKAYQILNSSNEPVSLTYPECDGKNFDQKDAPVEVSNPWNTVIKTPSTHVFGIQPQALSQFETGDIVGAFTADGYCAGAIEIVQRDMANVLVAFADDQTSSVKDGFSAGEAVSFKVFRPSTGEEFIMEATWSLQAPGQGEFINNGISLIEKVVLKSTITGIQPATGSDIVLNIYPNPSTGTVNLLLQNGALDKGTVSVLNINGQTVFETAFEQLNSTAVRSVDLSGLSKGIYYLKVTSDSFIRIEKIVLH